MKLIISLGLRNLLRNKARTLLTSLAVVVLICVFSFVQATLAHVAGLVSNEASKTRLLVTERWVAPSLFPIRYVNELAGLPGVQDWTIWYAALGYFDEYGRGGKETLALATLPDNLVEMHPGIEAISPAALEAFRTRPDAALVGQGVLDRMQWEIGRQFTFVRKNPLRKNVPLTIVGVIPKGRWEANMFIRHDYFSEVTGENDLINWFWCKTPNQAAVERFIAGIEREFGDASPSLKVETESSGVARVTERNQSALAVLELIAYVLLIDMTLILSNSMTIAARERRYEVAVLKVIGYTPRIIMWIVSSEAIVNGAVGGLLGVLAAFAISKSLGGLSVESGYFASVIHIPLWLVLTGPVLGAVVGLASSIYPAWVACRAKPTDVFVGT